MAAPRPTLSSLPTPAPSLETVRTLRTLKALALDLDVPLAPLPPHFLLVAALLLTTALALLLTQRAARHWRTERAGRPYELPVDRRGTALRTAAATAAALTAATLAATLLRAPEPAHPVTAARAATPAPATQAADPAVPPPPPRTPEPAPPPPRIRTLGHPAGGTLQVLQDGTQVWLPPRYDSARAAGLAYPTVLARTPAPGDGDLYAGFALQVDRRLADPFIVVMPRDCTRPAAPVLTEVAAHYRTLTTPTAQAVLGVGPDAPCAVREALADPARYTAAVGVSGTYPALAAIAGPGGPRPGLLLASVSGESASHASARGVRATLRPLGTEVRVLDGVPRRRELFAMIASYLTEKLDGPARLSATTP